MGQIMVEVSNDKPVIGTADPAWIIVGEQATQSLIVRTGANPFAIAVSHRDSTQLLQLVKDANRGAAHAKSVSASKPSNSV